MARKQTLTHPNAAMSYGGAREGLANASVGTTEVGFDLSDYVGRYVKIYCPTEAIIFGFAETNAGALVTGAAASVTALVPDGADAGYQGAHVVVPEEAPFLRVAAAAGSGHTVRVVPT